MLSLQQLPVKWRELQTTQQSGKQDLLLIKYGAGNRIFDVLFFKKNKNKKMRLHKLQFILGLYIEKVKGE